MPVLIHIVFVAALAAVGYHDFRSMRIPLVILLLAISAGIARLLLLNHPMLALQMSLINLLGTTLMMLLSIMYLILKRGKVFNPVNRLIGSGDLLFLPVLCFSFSPILYLFFLISSSLVIILGRQLFGPRQKYIPLAGIQAALLVVLLVFADIFHFSLYSDHILINLLLQV